MSAPKLGFGIGQVPHKGSCAVCNKELDSKPNGFAVAFRASLTSISLESFLFSIELASLSFLSETICPGLNSVDSPASVTTFLP